MQGIVEQLEGIELKIKELGKRYTALKQENHKLLQENKSLVNNPEQLTKVKKQLESQLVEALSEARVVQKAGDERSKINKELGQYIKEIDKCILLMGDI
jgi:cell division septum initiation protein DivIVA